MSPARAELDARGSSVAPERRLRSVFAGAVLLACGGCSVNRMIPAADLFSSHPPVQETAGLRIGGYTTRDGEHHHFEGFASVAGDSVTFHHPAKEDEGLVRGWPAVRLVMSRDEVTSVDAVHTDITRSVVLSVVLVTFVTALLFLGGFSGGAP